MDSLTDSDVADTISFNPIPYHLLKRKAGRCEDHDCEDDMSEITMLNGFDPYEEMKILLNCDAAQSTKPKSSDENERMQRKKRKRNMSHRRRKRRSRNRWFYRQKQCSMPIEGTTGIFFDECKHVSDKKLLKLPKNEQLLMSSFWSQNFYIQHTSATLKLVKAMLRSQMSREIIFHYISDKKN